MVHFPPIHSLLAHLQEILPSLDADYRRENAKSLGSRITNVPVESTELLGDRSTDSYEGRKKPFFCSVCCWRTGPCPRQQQVVNGSLKTLFNFVACSAVSVCQSTWLKKMLRKCWLVSLPMICLTYTRCLTDHIKGTLLTASNLCVVLLLSSHILMCWADVGAGGNRMVIAH